MTHCPAGVLPTPCAWFRNMSQAFSRGPRPSIQVSATRYRIRCPAFGSRPSAWTKDEGKSYLPRPSSLHSRGPDTEHRGPSWKARYRKTRTSGLPRWTHVPRHCPTGRAARVWGRNPVDLLNPSIIHYDVNGTEEGTLLGRAGPGIRGDRACTLTMQSPDFRQEAGGFDAG